MSVTASGAASGPTLRAVYENDAPGVVYVRARLVVATANPFTMFHQAISSISTGSGFLVDHRGDILTDFHVIDGADRSGGVTVQFEGGVIRAATVAAVDRSADLAVLKVDLRGVPAVRPLPLGESMTVRVGDPTLAIGNPFGVDRTLTSGIVSALQHQIQASDGSIVDNVIQTDQPLDPSSSGGPLLDGHGLVIGVNSQVADVTGQGRAVSFATPIDTAIAVLARAQRAGVVRLAYIGLSGVPSRAAPRALTITSAPRGGPAAAAGLRPGDTLERLDGVAVSSMSEIQRLIATRSPGQTVSVQIRRAGRVRVLDVSLGALPGAAAQ